MEDNPILGHLRCGGDFNIHLSDLGEKAQEILRTAIRYGDTHDESAHAQALAQAGDCGEEADLLNAAYRFHIGPTDT